MRTFLSEEIRTMKLSGRLFFENTRKPFQSSLVVVLLLESKGRKDSELEGAGGRRGLALTFRSWSNSWFTSSLLLASVH